MIYVITIAIAVGCVIMFWIGNRLFDNDYTFPAIIALIMAIVLALGGLGMIGQSISYADYKANAELRDTWRAEERNVLITMLGEIGTLMSQDVTASDTYLEIYDRVIKFNRNVREAQKWTGTIWEGLMCDPSYAKLDIIPLN